MYPFCIERSDKEFRIVACDCRVDLSSLTRSNRMVCVSSGFRFSLSSFPLKKRGERRAGRQGGGALDRGSSVHLLEAAARNDDQLAALVHRARLETFGQHA